MRFIRFGALVFTLVLAACGGNRLQRVPDGGSESDAGVNEDAGLGADAGETDAGEVDAGEAIDAGTPEVCDGVDDDGDGLIDEGPNDEVMGCALRCNSSLFAALTDVEEFSDDGGYAARWSAAYVPPVLGGDALTFGPYPTSPNWWDKYGWTATYATYGEGTLVCAHVIVTPSASREQDIDLFVRGAGDPLVDLSLHGQAQMAYLSVRVSATTDTWVGFDAHPLSIEDAGTAVDELLYVRGDKLYGEVRSDDGGILFGLKGTATVPDAGQVGLIGYDIENAIRVDRVVIGTPSAAAQAILNKATAP